MRVWGLGSRVQGLGFRFQGAGSRFGGWRRQTGGAAVHFDRTPSVYTVVLHKPIPAQICQHILYHYQYKKRLTDWCGIRLLQNDFINTLCEISLAVPCRSAGAYSRTMPFDTQGLNGGGDWWGQTGWAGCRVQGAGFRVQGSGFRVHGSGFRVHGSWFRVQGSGCRVQGPGSAVGGGRHEGQRNTWWSSHVGIPCFRLSALGFGV